MAFTIRINGMDNMQRFEKALEKAPDLLPTIAKNLAEETVGLIADEFRSERDPFGDKWAEKKIPDGRKVLSGKTSRLKKWHRKSSGKRGFVVAATVKYAVYHQAGRRRMVARKMIPEGRLPPRWGKAYRAAARDVIREHFNGR